MLKFLLSLTVLSFLTACGGGGGSSPQPPNTVTINTISTVNNTTQDVTFSGFANDPGNLTLTYSWDFGDGQNGNGTSVSHRYTKNGVYTVTLKATNTANLSSIKTLEITIYAPPEKSTINASINSPNINQNITLTGQSIDPNGLPLNYIWDFGDNTPTSTTVSPVHSFSVAGNYLIKQTVSNTVGLSTINTLSINVYNPLGSPTITSSNPIFANPNQTTNYTANIADPDKRVKSFTWDFGDGIYSTGNPVSHAYSKAGTYTIKVSTTDLAENITTGSYSQFIGLSTDNSIISDCSGVNCASVGTNSYAGTGIGVWKYNNTTSKDALVNLNFTGLSQNTKINLIFSNASNSPNSSLPNFGVSASSEIINQTIATKKTTTQRDSLPDEHDKNHSLINSINRKNALELSKTPKNGSFNGELIPAKPSFSPSVGTTKSWYESAFDKVSYSTKVVQTCQTATGRNIVFWADSSYPTVITDTEFTAAANAYCGTSGGLSKITNFMGDVWGPTKYSGLISDTPNKLDVNLVFVKPAAVSTWAGYFSSVNTYLKTSKPDSNEALLFFINSTNFKSNTNYYLSTLFHETIHMINWYQRLVLLGKYHDDWLEETSAMMGEDIFLTAQVPTYNKMRDYRIPNYVKNGGAVSLVNWVELSDSSYNMGGAFGAYLNRKYGLKFFYDVLKNCDDGVTGKTSYDCINSLIKSNNGVDIVEDFSRFNASVFSLLPATNLPKDYGYPLINDSGFTLVAIDNSVNSSKLPTTAPSLSGGYTATTSTYKVDTLNVGVTTYVKNNVLIPANTNLTIVIK